MLGKLICFALQEESGVDEGFVIQAQCGFDSGLRFAQRPLSQRFPIPVFGFGLGAIVARLSDLKLEHGRFPPRFGSLDTVFVVLICEHQDHLRRIALGVDDRIVALARLAEERPCDRVQQ